MPTESKPTLVALVRSMSTQVLEMTHNKHCAGRIRRVKERLPPGVIRAPGQLCAVMAMATHQEIGSRLLPDGACAVIHGAGFP